MNAEESIEITALSVDEAIIIGLTRLTATRDEVDITILDEGSRGFLGLGTRMARVSIARRPLKTEETTSMTSNVMPSVPNSNVPQEEPAILLTDDTQLPGTEPSKSTPSAGDEDTREPQPHKTPASVSDDTLVLRQQVEDAANVTADHLLSNLSIQLSTEWREDEGRPTLWISIRGADADAIVGPHAQTLNAVQYLFRTLVHRQVAGNYNLVVDADGYRMRRMRSLENLAHKNAEKAVQSGRTVHLRSMPAYERRIIHMLLRDDIRVETRSVGSGRDRAVTIIPTSASDK